MKTACRIINKKRAGMNKEDFLSIIADEDYVGLNDPTTDAQIAMVNMKLQKSGLPKMPQDFSDLLKLYNGISYEGNVIFGINTDTDFFPDLVTFNSQIISYSDEAADCLILGRDEEFLLAWYPHDGIYRIIDSDDFSEYRAAPDLYWAILWILKI